MPMPGGAFGPGGGARGAKGGMTNPNATASPEDSGLKRTEFVILFIWKEPTDSDRLRNLKPPEGSAAAPAGADAQPRFLRPRSKKQKTP
jgi:hypothetical protein